MCKCCNIKCFPTNKTIFRCGCFYLTYFKVRFLVMLISFGIFFFDIASDILVLIDLDKTNSEYFNICLIIVLLPTFYNIVNSIRNWPRWLNVAKIGWIKFFLGVLWLFIKTVLQINIMQSAFGVLMEPYGRDNQVYMTYRMNECLLESAPQALFQLFIILKNAHIYSINQISIYYISIAISVFSLVSSLISYEVNMFNSSARTIFLIKNLSASNNFDGKFNIRQKILNKNTFYVALLTLYRLTEVVSRIGILTSIGIIYDGYAIIWFLIADFSIILLSNLVIIFNNFNILCSNWPPWRWQGLTWRELEWWFRQTVILQIYLSLSVEFILSQVKNLAIFNDIFINHSTFINDEEVQPQNMASYTKKRISAYHKSNKNKLITHFISRYLNNLILSILIIYNLIFNSYSKSLTIISISSICCFVLNIICLPFIIKYVYKYKKYYKVFKPINPFEYCKCCECCKTSNNNTISKSKESKLSGESKKNIKDLIETENKIIITNVKHPDDILI
uniref:Uncharacterized protein n=1 Tax=viral metagenome TaxID=1070528 RepID=A0A6C0BYK2_9ZZZZ